MSAFTFKHFRINQDRATMKVGTDAMVLGSFVDVTDKFQGLDIGTGTGVISLMLAQRNSELKITAVDIDSGSVEDAQQNFSESDWSERLSATQQDVLSINSNGQCDLIFSNPPYYQDSLQNEDLRMASAKHEVFLPIDALVAKVETLLSSKGHFWIIAPYENCKRWIDTCGENGLFLARSIQIYGKEGEDVKRVILSFSRTESEYAPESFSIRTESGAYTSEYIELTKEYHNRAL